MLSIDDSSRQKNKSNSKVVELLNSKLKYFFYHFHLGIMTSNFELQNEKCQDQNSKFLPNIPEFLKLGFKLCVASIIATVIFSVKFRIIFVKCAK